MTAQHKRSFEEIVLSYYSVAANSLALMVDNAEIFDCVKDHFICTQNRNASHELFILQGVFQSVITNSEGEPVTTGFYTQGMVVTPHFARTVKGKSLFSIQALTDAVYAQIPVAVLDSLRYSYNDIRQFGLKVVEQELMKTIRHDISFRSANAKQRLLDFRQIYPGLENLVPHTIIASYLGITPVSFSRLRSDFSG
jgi:CRP-like cAMP-binding protein